jgi:TRAP-type C4-dicarboxylate transport system substrate-binding protein
VTDDYRLLMRAQNELMDTYAPLKAEWDKYSIMFLSAQAPDPVHLFTKFPVKSFEDIKGHKISGIGSIGSWLNALGGVPISSPLPSMYNDIQTGVSEGAMTVATAVASVKVHEVAPNITLLKMGSFYAGAVGISKAAYDKLPGDVQKVVREVGRSYADKLAELLDRDVARAMKLFREDGAKLRPPVVVTEMSDAERTRMFKTMRNVAQDWARQVEASGQPGRQMLATYMDTLRKHGAKPARDWDKE